MAKKTYYPAPNQNLDFAKMEANILKFWQENKIFEQSIANRDHLQNNSQNNKKNEFVFYDGPPFANGLPHYGHLLTGFIKDIVARYQTMKGKKVERRFGWDTHGLPVEMEVEKELGVAGQIAIKEYGIEKFNASCQKSVMKYSSEWQNYVNRQGRWVDFKNDYKTMDINYMESVIWVFKELYKKGLVYEDFKVLPYSWACQTPLSNFETRMDNAYRRKESKAITVKFELEQIPEFLKEFGAKKVSLLAWTTTPWTLPSNLALAVGKDIDYIAISLPCHSGVGRNPSGDKEVFILAKSCLEKYNKDFGEFEIIISFKGKEVIGLDYQALFPYFVTGAENIKNLSISGYEKCFTILHGDFVSTEDGTGIVHLAPGFGEDDQLLCKSNGIPILCPVDEGARFQSGFNTGGVRDIFNKKKYNNNINLPNLEGRQVFETNDDIIKYLKTTGAWLKTEQYFHNYPHCWRTDTPLIYKAVPSWYVEVTKIKDKMIANNQEINWIPENVKDGQFGKWLEGARDWAISRNRFWGCPVPVWKSNDPAYPRIDVYGSLDEIERDFGMRPDNLHRPFIDQLTRSNPDDPTGKSKMIRVTDVLDCWFESGSMPYGQAHYPFENEAWFENNFPADFITEYVAQTRGWFYTLMVLSTALFNRPPFKNVICHGTILDENAQKLSKRLRNYADPLEIFSTYGSDAMRFYMISQPVMRGGELKIDKDGKAIRDALRLSIKPLINATNFFCLYANSDLVKAKRITAKREFKNIIDRYILAKLKSAIINIDQAMTNYDTVTASEEFNNFFEVLNNWYIRRNRARFWKSGINQDKQDAYDVLYSILLTMCEAVAPLLPFTTEFVWKSLNDEILLENDHG